MLLLVTGQTRWEATIERGYSTSNSELGMTPSERDRAESEMLASLVTAEAFPYLYDSLHAAFVEGPLNPFAFGLAVLLDGIGLYIAERAAGAPARQADETPSTDTYPRDAAVKAARQARREAETKLREAQKREREAIKSARERERQQAEKAKKG